MGQRTRLGAAGEAAAVDFYTRHGFRVLDRNYVCDQGEIDLVLGRGRLVVFCEVKARSSVTWGNPAEAVGRRKQARLRRLAGRWLGQRGRGRHEVRFDVVSVVASSSGLEVTHLPAAF